MGIDKNSLMLGDWVFLDGVPSRVGLIEANPQTVYVKNERLGIRVDMEDVDPIPLTAEILEQNGWDKKWHDRSRCTVFDPKNDHVTTVVYDYHNATISIDGLPFNAVNKHNECCQKIEALGCRYVHQLQHALRLCGIEEEITITREL